MLIILGQRMKQSNIALSNRIDELLLSKPKMSALQIVTTANKELVANQVRDSMQVSPGVTVMQPMVAGRLTTSMDGSPGIMSRNNITSVIARNEQGNIEKMSATQ